MKHHSTRGQLSDKWQMVLILGWSYFSGLSMQVSSAVNNTATILRLVNKTFKILNIFVAFLYLYPCTMYLQPLYSSMSKVQETYLTLSKCGI